MDGIISELVEPLVPWTTRWVTPHAVKRSTNCLLFLELRDEIFGMLIDFVPI